MVVAASVVVVVEEEEVVVVVVAGEVGQPHALVVGRASQASRMHVRMVHILTYINILVYLLP